MMKTTHHTLTSIHSNISLCQRMAGAIGLEPTTPGFGVMVNVVTPSIHST